ncbi:MAG TPA: MBL fold metallo-hydrolase [Aeromicrobium sp.]|nr:MBL fold metallo-hydrolase [Aeromicrobium sp.]
MIAVTWWGHSFATVELVGTTVVTDPVMSRRLFHLRRESEPPPASAAQADVVLISHLHHDHLHMPTLRRFDDDVPIVVPKGAPSAVRSLGRLETIEVEPGDQLSLAGVDIEVLAANHDGRRDKRPGAATAASIGFRVKNGAESFWYPGDTGPMDFSSVAPVDLALVPVGGWGPSLGPGHVDPAQAAQAVRDVGARWAVPVHYGTYWPIVLRSSGPTNHHWFRTPAPRFREAVRAQGLPTKVVVPEMGMRTLLTDELS